ncbi:histidine phosphatase superfamily [Daldinia decipiens]|uniref:histidine phosphatase superfamily n=1 Tax=Daldinia decipiens TaxID=326647 RepID=UPI0020C37021|nr:histidine phosphatase superfamily [Daldinia decipiens]KAI1655847.1 histidine phosphatase superfamily [Daldinia decipiens]
MAPTIDIIRHGQAAHNVYGSHVRDAVLTDSGVAECDILRETFPFGSMVTNIVSSPLRRAIDTAILGVLPTVNDHIKIKLLPDLQEISPAPSSTGISKSALFSRYNDGHNVDMDDLNEYWYRKGFDTPYAPEVYKVEARARSARQYLRMLARKAIEAGKDDAHIVVVTHGEFAHWLTRDFRGVSGTRSSGWFNTEWRSYRIDSIFRSEHTDPWLTETTESVIARNGSLIPWSMSVLTKYSPRNFATMRVIEYSEMVHIEERRLSTYQTTEAPERSGDEYDESDESDESDEPDISNESDGWVDVDQELD